MKKLSILILIIISISLSLSSQEKTVVTGKLLGYDGKPMEVSDIYLAKANHHETLKGVKPAKSGEYKLEFTETGNLEIRYSGLFHKQAVVPLLLGTSKKIKLDIQLKTYHYQERYDSVKVFGDFNNWDYKTSIPCVKNANNTWSIEVISGNPKVAFKFTDLTDDWQLGTGNIADEFEYDGNGGYNNIVKTINGKAKLKIDVAKLPVSNKEEQISFGKKNDFEQKYKEYNFKYGNIYNEIYKKYMEAKKKKIDGKTFFKTFDILPYIKKLNDLVENENDEFFRQYLNLSKYEIYSWAGIYDADSVLADNLLKTIPANSPLWQIDPRTFFLLTNASNQDSNYVYKFDDILKTAKSDNFKAEFSFWGIGNFIFKKDRKNETKYYNYLITTFPETDWAKWAVMDFSPDRKIMVGKQIPAFFFKSLYDSSFTISDSTLKGKYYLIDLWATWCVPCVAEMKALSIIYEKYKSRNFEIVSFSFDSNAETVVKFQKEDCKMPWLNVFVSGESESEFGKTFQTKGLPGHLLIDPTGKIIETEEELRIEDLDKTLEKYLK